MKSPFQTVDQIKIYSAEIIKLAMKLAFKLVHFDSPDVRCILCSSAEAADSLFLELLLFYSPGG